MSENKEENKETDNLSKKEISKKSIKIAVNGKRVRFYPLEPITAALKLNEDIMIKSATFKNKEEIQDVDNVKYISGDGLKYIKITQRRRYIVNYINGLLSMSSGWLW